MRHPLPDPADSVQDTLALIDARPIRAGRGEHPGGRS
ncbi:hypothetical protein ABIA38_008848 [Embleya sp. AB8]